MSKFDKEIKNLIKKEGLNDLAIFFHNYETYEEIPLFSKYKNISFLSKESFNEKNKTLIKKCIELEDICTLSSPHYIDKENVKDYFICITITDWDDYEDINCLTPNIFVSRRKNWLLSNLNLRSTQTIEENIIREYLYSINAIDYKAFISDGFLENKRVYVIRDLI